MGLKLRVQVAKITGSQDRWFGSENKRDRQDQDAWIPGIGGQTVGKKGLGEPRSLGSRTAASQNSRVCVSTLLFLFSIRQEREEGGRRRDQAMG